MFRRIGHCRIKKHNKPIDTRPSHPLTPIYKRMEITEFFKRRKTSLTSMKITIVPKIAEGMDRWFVHIDTNNLIKLEKIILRDLQIIGNQ